MSASENTCDSCGAKGDDVYLRVDGTYWCDACDDGQTHLKTVDPTDDTNDPVINELLCYVQFHVQRSTKENIAACVGRFYSLERVVEARDLLSRMYDSKLSTKLKNRRNTSNKMKIEQTSDDIVTAMVELDRKGIETNFVAKNVLQLPRCDPKDIDPYATLHRLLMLEERVKSLETGVGDNKADLLMQNDNMTKMKQVIDTHELLLTTKLLPTSPSYADVTGQNGIQNKPGKTQSKQLPKKVPHPPEKVPHPPGKVPQPEDKDGPGPGATGGGDVPLPQTPVDTSNPKDKDEPSDEPADDDGDRNVVNNGDSGNDKWKVVGRNGKPQKPFTRQKIRGSAQTDDVLGAPLPNRDFFVSRVHSSTNDNKLKQFISKNGIKQVGFVLVSNDKAKFKSYKLTVPSSDVNKVMVADKWPIGVCVEPWKDRSKSWK